MWGSLTAGFQDVVQSVVDAVAEEGPPEDGDPLAPQPLPRAPAEANAKRGSPRAKARSMRALRRRPGAR